jgi:hypothetical protein
MKRFIFLTVILIAMGLMFMLATVQREEANKPN